MMLLSTFRSALRISSRYPGCGPSSVHTVRRAHPRTLDSLQTSVCFHSSTFRCRSETRPKTSGEPRKVETTSLAAQMMLKTDSPAKMQTTPDEYDLDELEALARSVVTTPDLMLQQGLVEEDETDDVITSDVTPASVPEGDIAFEMFGNPDPTIPMSSVPCAGCGASLHCQDPAIPGYLPSQKYTAIPTNKLRTTVCQRCLLMKRHNIALNVSVHPEEYNKIISQIRRKGGLAIIVVDLLDMPNSIFKDLPELIGHDRPLYVIGNKVDLVPKDETGYLLRTKDMLMQLCKEAGLTTTNEIRHTALVSAKTGYGIEELITRLLKDWGKKGRVPGRNAIYFNYFTSILLSLGCITACTC